MCTLLVFPFILFNRGVAPEKCLAIEDSPAGIQSAKAAGLTVVAFPHAYIQDAISASLILSSRISDNFPIFPDSIKM
jgi:beta-phosphoglucomutase-like phosphatase (HAD superfamily)